MDIPIRSIEPGEQARVAEWTATHWGSDRVAVHGTLYYPAELPGFVALDPVSAAWLGMLTYQIQGLACEIITIDSDRPGQGIGAALIVAVRRAAVQAGCRRLWLITTNDNLPALRFYQKRGFILAALHPGAVMRSRQIKPQIPLLGWEGIPLRDELELEMRLEGQEARP